MVLRFKLASFDGALLLISVAVCIILPLWYYHHEHYVPFWDLTFYYNRAHELAHELRKDLSSGLVKWFAGIDQPYSTSSTLLPALFLRIFGDGRDKFYLALSLLYGLPLALICGKIGQQLVVQKPGDGNRIFSLAVLVVLLQPAIWDPIFKGGWPDAGGAALVFAALSLYFSDRNLRSAITVVGIGLLFAVAFIFRRHLAYTMMAFAVMINISAAARARFDINEYKRFAWRGAIISVISACILIPLYRETMIDAVVNPDFVVLASWKASSLEWMREFIWSIGAVFWVLGIAGIAHAMYRADVSTITLCELLTLAVIWLLLWAVVVRQPSVQYFVGPFVLILGLGTALLIDHLRNSQNILKKLSGYMLILILCINLSGSLGAIPINAPAMITKSIAPYTRTDMDDLKKIVTFLRENSGENEMILPAATSHVINGELLIEADKMFFPKEQRRLNIWWNSGVDSRDPPPLSMIATSPILIIARPLQWHLRPSEHKIIQAIIASLDQEWPISQSYRKIGPDFRLEGGAVEISVFRRTWPISREDFFDAFERLEKILGPAHLARQQFYVANSAWWWRVNSYGTLFSLHPSVVGADATSVALNPRLNHSSRITGSLKFWHPADCRGVNINVVEYSPGRSTVKELATISPAENLPFSYERAAADSRIVFEFVGIGNDRGSVYHCGFDLQICTAPCAAARW